MFSILLSLIGYAYLLASLAAILAMVFLDGPPVYLDRATTYGDERLNWKERLVLIVFLPAILLYVWWHDKWPGIKKIVAELWVTIVLGRQANAKDML